MIDVKHTQITLGDRRSRFTNDLDSSRTILIGGNRHEGFSSEPTEKQNLTMNREYPRANGSTLVNHNFPSSSSYCQGRGRLSQRGGHDDYRVLRTGSVDYWENLLEGMPDYRDCCSNYFCWTRSLSGWIITVANVYNISNILYSWYGRLDDAYLWSYFIVISNTFRRFIIFLMVYLGVLSYIIHSFDSKLYLYYDWNVICQNGGCIMTFCKNIIIACMFINGGHLI